MSDETWPLQSMNRCHGREEVPSDDRDLFRHKHVHMQDPHGDRRIEMLGARQPMLVSTGSRNCGFECYRWCKLGDEVSDGLFFLRGSWFKLYVKCSELNRPLDQSAGCFRLLEYLQKRLVG
ncbi:unnamed protein product [Prunus armeniaca]